MNVSRYCRHILGLMTVLGIPINPWRSIVEHGKSKWIRWCMVLYVYPPVTSRLLPLILIILGFGSLEGVYRLLHRIQNCSCWWVVIIVANKWWIRLNYLMCYLYRCVPYFGNVVPLAYEHDQVGSTGKQWRLWLCSSLEQLSIQCRGKRLSLELYFHVQANFLIIGAPVHDTWCTILNVSISLL